MAKYNLKKYKLAEKVKNLTEILDEDTLNRYEESKSLSKNEPINNIEENTENILKDNGIIEEVSPEDVLPYEKPERGEWSIRGISDAINYAISNEEVIQIRYMPVIRNRHIYRTKSEKRYTERYQKENPNFGGVVVVRKIEPMERGIAKTGNDLVVAWDRTVGDYRKFNIDKIIEYRFMNVSFSKNRKFDYKRQFKRNPMKGVLPIQDIFPIESIARNINDNRFIKNSGIAQMNNMQNRINKVASLVEDKNMSKTASMLRGISSSLTEAKIAQYVGIQGYWLKNRRCWDNCYRSKRTKNPNFPAQKVWTECWKEYNEALANDDSKWSKYASDSTNRKEWEGLDNKFVKEVKYKVANTEKTLPEAVYSTISDREFKNSQKMAEINKDIIIIASSLRDGGFEKEASELISISEDMMKEAGFWDTVGKGVGAFGRGIGDAIGRSFSYKNQTLRKLEDLSKTANEILGYISSSMYNLGGPQNISSSPQFNASNGATRPAPQQNTTSSAKPFNLKKAQYSTDFGQPLTVDQILDNLLQLIQKANDVVAFAGKIARSKEIDDQGRKIMQDVTVKLSRAAQNANNLLMNRNKSMNMQAVSTAVQNIMNASNEAITGVQASPDVTEENQSEQAQQSSQRENASQQTEGDKSFVSIMQKMMEWNKQIDNIKSKGGRIRPDSIEKFKNYFEWVNKYSPTFLEKHGNEVDANGTLYNRSVPQNIQILNQTNNSFLMSEGEEVIGQDGGQNNAEGYSSELANMGAKHRQMGAALSTIQKMLQSMPEGEKSPQDKRFEQDVNSFYEAIRNAKNTKGQANQTQAENDRIQDVINKNKEMIASCVKRYGFLFK